MERVACQQLIGYRKYTSFFTCDETAFLSGENPYKALQFTWQKVIIRLRLKCFNCSLQIKDHNALNVLVRLPSQAWKRQNVAKDTIKETNGNSSSECHLPGIDWRMVCTTICNPGKELMLWKEIEGELKCISMEAHSYKLAAQQKKRMKFFRMYFVGQ